MRKTILLFLLLPWPLAAQSALSIAPQQCVWKQGDDMRWAATDIDESGWQPAATWQAIATPTPNFWLRCRFDPRQLAAAVDPRLQVSGDLAWQVFANGRSVGASGNISTGAHTVGLDVDYPASEFSRRGQPVVVAVRMTFTPQMNSQQSLPQLYLGDAEFQHNAYLSNIYQRTQAQWVTWGCYALIASAGLFFLMLYWFDRTQRYVLWVSLTWLSLADLRVNEFLVSASVHYPSFLEFFLYSVGQAVPVFVILFYFALNQRPVPLVFKILAGINFYYWLALVVAAFLPLRASMALRWATEVNASMSTIQVVATLAAVLSVPVAFWPLRALRGSQIPLAAVCLIWASMDFAYVFVQFPFLSFDIGGLFLRIQPYRSAAIAVVVVSMTLLLVQRIRSTNEERAELHGEMASAREIQQYLIPEKLPPTPGLTIRSVYQPFARSGRRFFPGASRRARRQHVNRGRRCGGKGAKSRHARGADRWRHPHRIQIHLRSRQNSGPAQRKAARPRISHMPGHAHRSQTEALSLANAGHLPPYINGKELALDGALPLGALPDISFPVTRFQLSEGESPAARLRRRGRSAQCSRRAIRLRAHRAISTQSAETHRPRRAGTSARKTTSRCLR